MQAHLFNAIKEYPDMIQVIIYKEPSQNPIYFGSRRKRRKASDLKDEYLTLDRSVRRSRVVIRDLVLCNDFDWFCTFTFDPKKHDRYNFNHLKITMIRWLKSQILHHSPNLKYLVVPELHKDGAIHFHVLLKNFNGHTRLAKKKTKGNYEVYNLTGFRGGFTTASPLDDNKLAVAEYVSKYITKELIALFNKNRYFCSKDLKRPIKYHNKFFNFKKLKDLELHADSDYYKIFRIKNTIDNKKLLMLNSELERDKLEHGQTQRINNQL